MLLGKSEIWGERNRDRKRESSACGFTFQMVTRSTLLQMHFVLVACAPCKETKSDDDRKILFLIEHCSVHPPAEILFHK